MPRTTKKKGKGKNSKGVEDGEPVYNAELAEELKGYVSRDSMFSGSYTITDYIGCGQHSVVFAGVSKRGGVPVCIKIELQCGRGKLALLGTENLILQKLPKNAKRLLRAGAYIPGCPYPPNPAYTLNVLVTNLCGDTLDVWMRDVLSTARLDGAALVHICNEVLMALQEAHSAEYVHRDIRPDNFCVSVKPGKTPRICLIDFGIAKPHSFLQADYNKGRVEPVVVGTEPYVSWRGTRKTMQSYRDDIEAAGFMLWKLHTGSLPWEGKGANEAKALKEIAPLSEDAPQWVREYMSFCRQLDFGQVPDYKALSKLVAAAVKSSGPRKKTTPAVNISFSSDGEESSSESSEYIHSPVRPRGRARQEQKEESDEEEEEEEPQLPVRRKRTRPRTSASKKKTTKKKEEEKKKTKKKKVVQVSSSSDDDDDDDDDDDSEYVPQEMAKPASRPKRKSVAKKSDSESKRSKRSKVGSNRKKQEQEEEEEEEEVVVVRTPKASAKKRKGKIRKLYQTRTPKPVDLSVARDASDDDDAEDEDEEDKEQRQSAVKRSKRNTQAGKKKKKKTTPKPVILSESSEEEEERQPVKRPKRSTQAQTAKTNKKNTEQPTTGRRRSQRKTMIKTDPVGQSGEEDVVPLDQEEEVNGTIGEPSPPSAGVSSRSRPAPKVEPVPTTAQSIVTPSSSTTTDANPNPNPSSSTTTEAPVSKQTRKGRTAKVTARPVRTSRTRRLHPRQLQPHQQQGKQQQSSGCLPTALMVGVPLLLLAAFLGFLQQNPQVVAIIKNAFTQ